MLFLAAAAASCSAPQTQADMTRCAAADYSRADAAMSAQWKQTYADMKGRDANERSRGGGFGYAAALLASQRAWLAYRDTQCVIAAGEFAAGSAQPMAAARCKQQLTNMRTTELKALVWRH